MQGSEIATGSGSAGGSPRLAGTSLAGPAPAARRAIGRFKLEAATLLLLVLTFAALQFQDLFARRTFTVTPDSIGRFAAYWYNDAGDGGRSAITIDRRRPLRWSCQLRPGFAYPFCGYGIMLDALQTGRGVDLEGFDTVTLRMRYHGPGERLRLNFARTDPLQGASRKVRPGELAFPVTQGAQSVRLDLDALSVPLWWAMQNHADALTKPPRDNITAIELQPGRGARNGRHDFVIESIVFEGRQVSQAQIYLALLVLWVSAIILFLFRRVLGIRRDFEQHQARQVRESRELRLAKSAAESASAAKSAFLANMSHELRTPLNAILGYAQMLERERLTARQASAARIIHQSGAHLLTLITDILDLARIEAGRLELVPTAYDLHSCVNGVAEMMQLRACEKGLDFVCTIEAGVPRFVEGDERRLRQVLINLLGNAIKFTATGKVSLLVSSIPASGGCEQLRVEVSDTGPGIAEEQKARIFEPFEQLGGQDRQSGGTGLGLAISRQIVELMGGRIEVDSLPGRGSRFWLELPVKNAAELGRAPSAVQIAAPGADGEDRMVPPPPHQLNILLNLAMAGNMRAIRAFADELERRGAEYEPFAERLRALAANYQSPAIMELVSRYTSREEIA